MTSFFQSVDIAYLIEAVGLILVACGVPAGAVFIGARKTIGEIKETIRLSRAPNADFQKIASARGLKRASKALDDLPADPASRAPRKKKAPRESER